VWEHSRSSPRLPQWVPMVLNLLRNNAAILLDGYYAMLAANLSRVKISTNIGPVGVAEKSTHAKKKLSLCLLTLLPLN